MTVASASFRSRVRAGVEPIARVFGRVGLTPNALTVIGLLIAVIGAYFAATQAWFIAGLVVAFGAIFDLFDGALARATGKTSNFGAFLDSSLDRAGEGVVYIGIVVAAVLGGLDRWLAPLAISASVAGYMVSYVRARSESLGFSPGTGMASVGLAPREVRTTILVIGLLAAGLLAGSRVGDCPTGVACTPTWEFALLGALGLIAVLSTVSAIQRILFTYRQSQTQEVSK
ncbi:MAG TPA: CDP-alcohol phosphatidyltransferase family protein [Candidatus Limnocylindria bacterium]|nr:CDP-alcohol phosphatidyltransferase family protein [Candidatus Limnocylindria bacterium]